ncbi:MAG: hypothetical protein JWM98_414 [Thermoleophilia bacterium]|nr:hypothetical protein [Thermoleophilia bacterium]
MLKARIRVAAAASLVTVAASAVALSLGGTTVASAADAAPLLATTPLFLTERFTPAGVPHAAYDPAATGGVVPEHLVALQGEREGFQFAFNNTSGNSLLLAADVKTEDVALQPQLDAGAISFETLRVAFTNLSRPSSMLNQNNLGDGYKAGVYEDALPPFRNASAAGQLSVDPGKWAGAAVIVKVRTDAAPGTYSGAIELKSGRANDTVYVRQPFTLEVRPKQLLQNGQPGSFKTVMHVEGDQYWLADKAMRNGAPDFPAPADRMLQLQGLMSFLDSRGVSLNEQPLGGPSASGAYTCSYASPNVPQFSFLDQTKNRYFGQAREINPAAQQFPTRMFPTETDGCDPSHPENGFDSKVDPHHTSSIKQDDVLDPKASTFFRNVAAAWAGNGLFGTNSYVKNPFDEPSDVTANMRYQYTTQVPKANTLLHAALKGRAKVVLADWPRDNTERPACRIASGHKSCTKLSGDGFSNRNMWDGKGTDDVDVWMAPFSRLFGRPVPPNLKAYANVPVVKNRPHEYADRLAKVKKLRGGREVWAYNFFTGNAQVPQLTIDAPATDARMNYWVLAREGHTGLFVSNSILGWGTDVKMNTGGTVRKGNPWDVATYFQHGTYGQAAGWGTFMYPGYRPQLGLNSEADRNSAQSRPVTTLRMEGLRDGQEDANLMRMFRNLRGAAGVASVTKPIFPGTYVQLPKQLGQVMFPKYTNDGTLALRLEQQRRTMIAAVAP